MRDERGLTTEEYMRAITIGERRPHRARIELVEYDPEWPGLFQHEEAQIRQALGQAALLVEHVGSTSVPGLAAKPIIDIILAVADTRDEQAYVPALERAGYTLRGREPEWHEHRLLKKADPAVHLHVFSTGCPEIVRMLAFRDLLRTDESERELYVQTKGELAARTWEHVQHYADSKTEVVEQILARSGRR
jgi:GrpB-like predicted nucleotidyltransferase (UPF0157 family)